MMNMKTDLINYACQNLVLKPSDQIFFGINILFVHYLEFS